MTRLMYTFFLILGIIASGILLSPSVADTLKEKVGREREKYSYLIQYLEQCKDIFSKICFSQYIKGHMLH